MRIKINRYQNEDKQTLGELFLLSNSGSVLQKFHSLELPWKNNQRNISCIPEGSYIAKVHYSPKFGKCLWLQDVPGRSEILIHKGNYYTDIRGCILIGTGLTDINADGYKDVTNSANAMRKLMSDINQNEITVKICQN